MTHARIYCRISEDKTEEGLGVERQQEDCEKYAAANGLSVVGIYVDNSISGYSGKQRPEWERLQSDMQPEDTILATEATRYSRNTIEQLQFIETCYSRGIKVVAVHDRAVLTDQSQNLMTGINAILAQEESRKIAQRVSRQKEQAAAMGKPMGGRYRTFGYDREWNIIEDEANVVREMFRLFNAGNSVNHVYKYVASLHPANPTTGKEMRYSTVRKMLQNPRYAGHSVLKGEIVGKANWESIIDDATWQASVIRWEGQDKSKTTNARKHLLSGFLYCGNCNRKMVIGHVAKGNTIYRCGLMEGCNKVSFRKDWLDREILHLVVEHSPSTAPAKVDYQPELDTLDAEIAELKAARQAGRISLGDFLEVLEDLNGKRDALIRKDAEQSVKQESVGTRYFKDYAALKRAELSEQRVAVAGVISAIMVDRATRKGRQTGPDWNRVTVAYADGTEENLGHRHG